MTVVEKAPVPAPPTAVAPPRPQRRPRGSA